jgi:EAL domain-containing protein (putative c-di-GMP-specific phosphodiesterase class I)
MSGDEFVVLAPAVGTEADALDLAERMLVCLREPIALAEGDMFVTASVGVVVAEPGVEVSAEELLRNADTAMYRAKDAGRNCLALFDPSMHERIANRLETETALRRALERNELRLHHQPIIDLHTGALSGFEALVRWQRPGLGMVSPAEFVPIAEDTGLIVPIGSWVIIEALTQLAEWTRTGVCSPDATISVNVSPRQLYDDHLVAVLAEALRRTGLAPERVWLEVTESIMITDPVRALEVLERLHDLGVRLSIDDFGTGYASLSVLKRYPIDRIKIDRSFVSDLDSDSGDRNLVRLIIDMAHGLGHDVVAEGVETRPQLAILQALGCDRGQGYFFSAPMAADSVTGAVGSFRPSRAA